MCKINPNYLLQDELMYELAICRVHLRGEVQLLRKNFRSVQAEEVPIVLEKATVTDAGEQLSTIAGNVGELETMLQQPAPGKINTVVRLEKLSLQLLSRLWSSVVREYPPAEIPLAKMETLIPRVDLFNEKANKLGATQGGVCVRPEATVSRVTPQVMVGVSATIGML